MANSLNNKTLTVGTPSYNSNTNLYTVLIYENGEQWGYREVNGTTGRIEGGASKNEVSNSTAPSDINDSTINDPVVSPNNQT